MLDGFIRVDRPSGGKWWLKASDIQEVYCPPIGVGWIESVVACVQLSGGAIVGLDDEQWRAVKLALSIQ